MRQTLRSGIGTQEASSSLAALRARSGSIRTKNRNKESPAGALIKLESSFSTLSIRAWPTRKFSVHRGLRMSILFRDIRENILVIRETFTLFSIRMMFRDWGSIYFIFKNLDIFKTIGQRKLVKIISFAGK